MDFHHGTGARRIYSLQKKGLAPRLNDFVYASPNLIIASTFALMRAQEEDDFGIVVSFPSEVVQWQKDPKFPDSFITKQTIEPKDLRFSMPCLDKETEIYQLMEKLISDLGMRIEA